MKHNLKRTVIGGALAIGLVVGTPAVALACDTHPPVHNPCPGYPHGGGPRGNPCAGNGSPPPTTTTTPPPVVTVVTPPPVVVTVTAPPTPPAPTDTITAPTIITNTVIKTSLSLFVKWHKRLGNRVEYKFQTGTYGAAVVLHIGWWKESGKKLLKFASTTGSIRKGIIVPAGEQIRIRAYGGGEVSDVIVRRG